VEAVGKDGILISEGNVIDDKTISYRIIPNELAYSQSVSYIAPK
jgi:surface antigen